jgi:flagellar protein FliS
MNAYDAYLESRILTADPIELVRVLYRGAIDSVEQAREALDAGDVPRRTRNINRAIEIITELVLSLQRGETSDVASDVASNLADLYDYMQRRLLEAHFQQSGPPLKEVSGLLKTLLEGWELCRPVASSDAAATGTDGQSPAYSQFNEELSEPYAPLSCSY